MSSLLFFKSIRHSPISITIGVLIPRGTFVVKPGETFAISPEEDFIKAVGKFVEEGSVVAVPSEPEPKADSFLMSELEQPKNKYEVWTVEEAGIISDLLISVKASLYPKGNRRTIAVCCSLKAKGSNIVLPKIGQPIQFRFNKKKDKRIWIIASPIAVLQARKREKM